MRGFLWEEVRPGRPRPPILAEPSRGGIRGGPQFPVGRARTRAPASVVPANQRLSAAPAGPRGQPYRRFHARRLDADKVRVIAGAQVAEGRGQRGAGVPDHGVGESRRADLQRTGRIAQREVGAAVGVDAIDLPDEPQHRLALVAGPTRVRGIEVGAILQAEDPGLRDIRYAQVGVQGGGELEGRVVAVGDGERGRQAVLVQLHFQLGAEPMRPPAQRVRLARSTRVARSGAADGTGVQASSRAKPCRRPGPRAPNWGKITGIPPRMACPARKTACGLVKRRSLPRWVQDMTWAPCAHIRACEPTAFCRVNIEWALLASVAAIGSFSCESGSLPIQARHSGKGGGQVGSHSVSGTLVRPPRRFGVAMLHPVILSGGSGSRLWPLSRQNQPKQFLTLIGDRSLYQETVLRANALPNVQPPVTVCSEDHRFMVGEQLQEIGLAHGGILLEPMARNTAPAIALAALHLLADDAQATMLGAACRSPDRGRVAFRDAVTRAAVLAEQDWLVTFGIHPDGPETGYGYIARGEKSAEGGYRVGRFVEKPDLATAQRYVDEGDYAWNSGMFLFKAQRYLDALGQHAPEILAAADRGLSRPPRRDLRFHPRRATRPSRRARTIRSTTP